MSKSEDKAVINPHLDVYRKSRSASGSRTMHSGDAVAEGLDGMNIDEVKMVAEAMGVEDINAYDHLNPGQCRMNLGNRIRGAVASFDRTKQYLQSVAEGEEATAKEQKAAERAKTGAEMLDKALANAQKAMRKRIREEEREAKAA